MSITAKVLISLGILFLLSTPSMASYDTTFFRISHVEATTDLSTPVKGQVQLLIRLWKEEGEHGIETPMLLLGETYQDHVKEVPLFCPNITGRYYLSVYCRGQGPFATQYTYTDKYFQLEKGTREIDISYACPMNHNATVISAPEELAFVVKKQ
jgi:hypothetical protein